MAPSTLSRALQPLVAAGYVVLAAGTDARSRLVRITQTDLAKRHEAQRHWRSAQTELNDRLGTARVAALHLLIEEAPLLGDDQPQEADALA